MAENYAKNVLLGIYLLIRRKIVSLQRKRITTTIMATTTARRRTSHPMSYYWNMVKDLDYSEKLELVSFIIDSMKSTVAQQPMRPYTKEEINSMIDQSERDIAEGRVYDFDEAMDELEMEFAADDRELEIADGI